MAIITFYSNEMKETGQTLSLAAIATHMAIEHNYRILIVSTSFNDLSLENCFWKYEDIKQLGFSGQDYKGAGLELGFEGLIKAIDSNRNERDIVKNHSKIILKDRLDMLLSPSTKSYQEYTKMTKYYNEILSIANRSYDIVFVDLSKKVPKQDVLGILQMSDIVMMTLIQKIKTIDDFVSLKEANDFFKRKNVMLNVGKYDKDSKYNSKNIARYLKTKEELSVIPYNTLYFEACSEGAIIDYFLKIRNIIDDTDKNAKFIEEIKKVSNNIIFRLQELQMKI